MDLFPYTNFHELNLDWVLKELKGIKNKISSIYTDSMSFVKRYLDDLLKKGYFSSFAGSFGGYAYDLFGSMKESPDSIDYCPDGMLILKNNYIYVYNTDSSDLVKSIEVQGAICAKYSNGSIYVLLSDNVTVDIYNYSSNEKTGSETLTQGGEGFCIIGTDFYTVSGGVVYKSDGPVIYDFSCDSVIVFSYMEYLAVVAKKGSRNTLYIIDPGTRSIIHKTALLSNCNYISCYKNDAIYSAVNAEGVVFTRGDVINSVEPWEYSIDCPTTTQEIHQDLFVNGNVDIIFNEGKTWDKPLCNLFNVGVAFNGCAWLYVHICNVADSELVYRRLPFDIDFDGWDGTENVTAVNTNVLGCGFRHCGIVNLDHIVMTGTSSLNPQAVLTGYDCAYLRTNACEINYQGDAVETAVMCIGSTALSANGIKIQGNFKTNTFQIQEGASITTVNIELVGELPPSAIFGYNSIQQNDLEIVENNSRYFTLDKTMRLDGSSYDTIDLLKLNANGVYNCFQKTVLNGPSDLGSGENVTLLLVSVSGDNNKFIIMATNQNMWCGRKIGTDMVWTKFQMQS